MNLTKAIKDDIRQRLVEGRFPSSGLEELKDGIRQALEADGTEKWKEAQMLASRYPRYIERQDKVIISGISIEDLDGPAWSRRPYIAIETLPYAGLYDRRFHCHDSLSFSKDEDGSITCCWGIDFSQPTMQAVAALFDWVEARNGMRDDLEALLGGISSSGKLIELLPEAEDILDEIVTAETGKTNGKDDQEKEVVERIREIIARGGAR